MKKLFNRKTSKDNEFKSPFIGDMKIYQPLDEWLKETWKERKKSLIGIAVGTAIPLITNFVAPKVIEYLGGSPELIHQVREYGMFTSVGPGVGFLIGYFLDTRGGGFFEF